MSPAQVKAKIWMSAAKGAVLPFATLMVVLFMMVPVPAIMLDLGFITNIMISLAVLMVALNAAKPLDFSSFPTVLLFATLLRLALNVASTRVVLVSGHEGADAAGQVIEAFGHFLIGGDYGFPFNPNGRNARDLEHFVTLYGYTPAEALSAATMLGGQLMGMGDTLGLVRPGYLADLILVDGDPLVDIAILQDRDRLTMVMKDGELHKAPAAAQPA